MSSIEPLALHPSLLLGAAVKTLNAHRVCAVTVVVIPN